MIAYVQADEVESFAAHVQGTYGQLTDIEPAIHVTAPSAGAGPLEF
jgi:galactokinase